MTDLLGVQVTAGVQVIQGNEVGGLEDLGDESQRSLMVSFTVVHNRWA
jgi:hypothetical protein